jgi:hypothetical protein
MKGFGTNVATRGFELDVVTKDFEINVVARGSKINVIMGGERSNISTSTILAFVARRKMGLNSKFFIIIKRSMAKLGNRKHKKNE